MFEYFIAKRYLHTKRKLNFITIISLLSTIGVTIGVAALIIVLSVLNGFGSLVTSILINFDPHIRVINTSNQPSDFNEMKKFLDSSPEIKSYSAFAEGKVILIKNKATEILKLKGIPPESKESTKRIKNKITFGSFDLTKSDGFDKIILSLPIAMRLSCKIGDTLFATSAIQIKKTVTRMSIPGTKPLIVSGIYEITNKEYSTNYSFTSLKAAQQLFEMGKKVSGLEIVLKNINNSNNFKQEIINKFKSSEFKVYTWYDLHKALYTVMLVERWAAYFLLSLIIAVAAFNILSSLTMTVLVKKKDIGILRSMGATKSAVKKIFMFEGILIGIIGTVTGIVFGLFVCFLQINFNIYSLDATKFVIDYLPVQIKFTDIIAVSVMSFLLTFLASKYPAKKALRTDVIDAIKWE